ncbi:MAG TPA: M56 family metallopeptidase [Longimicrobium sp.]|nr:M56 family metallopeptidase [Longimicrobium sp.]
MAPSAAPFTPALAQAALLVAKSTLLLGAAALGAHAMRRASAAARHLVWSLALGGLMALPALALLVPDWKPAALAVLRPASAAGEAWAGTAPVVPSIPLAVVLLAAWAAGAAYVLARLARGLLAVRRLARGAQVVDDPRWTDLLERLGRTMGVRRAVALLRSDEVAMPLTWGALRPAILLPAGADGWTPERRRVVLLHELAHVARRDCLMQTLAEACCAAWWFHPGAWWAARKMRIEREQACDDQVLAAGARASDYAGHLLDVARACRTPAPAAAIAMARASHLEGRVRAVLAAHGDRRAVTGRTAAVCAGAVLLASLPLAAVTPSVRPAAPRTGAQALARRWEMPPARGIHGGYTIDGRPGGRIAAAAPSRPASATPPGALAAAWPPKPRVAPAPATRSTPAPATVVARRDTKPAPTHPRSTRSRVRVEAPGVLASLDQDGNLHARVRLPEGVDVRVEGHGVRAVGNELRVDGNIGRIISSLAPGESGREVAKRPDASRRTGARAKKLATEVRRQLAGEKHDLALRVLAGVNGEVEGGEHPDKSAGEQESGGA